MKHDDIKQLNDDLSDMLSDRQVDDALAELFEACRSAKFPALASRAQKLQTDYGYMLDYFARGVEDSARGGLFDDLYDECWTLLDTLVDALERETSETFYYTTLRRLERQGGTLAQRVGQFIDASRRQRLAADADERQRLAEQLDDEAETLWLAIWTAFPATDDDRRAVETLLASDDVPYWHRASFLSAQTLALLTFFDESKAMSLVPLTAEGQPADIRMRAVTGLVLLALKYSYRIEHLFNLRGALELLTDDFDLPPDADEDEQSLLLQLQLQLLQAPEADTATKKMHDELAPELRRGLSEIQRRQGEQKKRRPMTDEEEMTVNPEWAEALNTDSLKAKIADFMKMQAEGTDVMMDGFMLMSRQPFFQSLHHWFVPFDMEQPWVQAITRRTQGLEGFLRMSMHMRNLCHTDRQAYFVGLAQTSDTMRSHLVGRLEEKGIDEAFVRDFKALNAADHTTTDDADVTRLYIHDLYRFFRTAPHHDEWENPFDDRELLDFASSPLLKNVTGSLEATQLIARYLFDKQRWPEAVAALQRWLERDTNEEALQKLAYAACQKEAEDLVLAHEALVTCNALYPDKEWTLRYLAQFYIRSEEFASAELLLDHACDVFPDDTDLLNKYASVLIAQNRFKEALEPLFKADLLKEGQPRTLRNLAWCNFMLQRGDKAEQYIRLLLERKPARTDWLNAGHIALQAGNLPLALERYRHCFDRGRWKMKDFEDAVYDDWSSLLDAGVLDADISLMLDVFRREVGYDDEPGDR